MQLINVLSIALILLLILVIENVYLNVFRLLIQMQIIQQINVFHNALLNQIIIQITMFVFFIVQILLILQIQTLVHVCQDAQILFLIKHMEILLMEGVLLLVLYIIMEIIQQIFVWKIVLQVLLQITKQGNVSQFVQKMKEFMEILFCIFVLLLALEVCLEASWIKNVEVCAKIVIGEILLQLYVYFNAQVKFTLMVKMEPGHVSLPVNFIQVLLIILQDYVEISVKILFLHRPLLIQQLLVAFKYVLKDCLWKILLTNVYQIV